MQAPLLQIARQRFTRWFTVSEHWLGNRSIVLLGLLVALVATFKAGISGITTDALSADSWPQPLPYYPFFSYGIRAIAFYSGASTPAHFAIIGGVLVVSAIVLVCLIVRIAAPNPPGRLIALVLLGGPVVWILVGRIGHPDGFAVVGGVILGLLGRQLPWAALGAVIACLGSPEHATLMSLGLLMVSFTDRFRSWRTGAAVSLAISLATWLSLTIWATALGFPSRLGVLNELVALSLERFFLHLPVILYSGFGLSLLVVLLAIFDQERSRGWMIAVGALGIPVVMTAVTMDQSRILVSVSIASTAAILLRYAEPSYALLQKVLRFPLTAIAAGVVLLPAIDVTGNVMRTPWQLYFPYLQAYVIDRIPLL